MKPVVLAVRAKGFRNYLRRGRAIVTGYGLTPLRMVHALDQFSSVLEEFHCGATCPVTATVVRRHSSHIERFASRGIEFAIHGYQHIDHSRLSFKQLVEHLQCAQEVFAAVGIPMAGFRSPYLQFNGDLRRAAEEVGLAYLSNQPIAWDVVSGESIPPSARAAYQLAVAFYRPWLAAERPALPRLYGQLVEIPISLPDDEILLDRLDGEANGLAEQAWSRILTETYRRDELFTLMLHPERTASCAGALCQLLATARSLDPPIWVARLDQISAWWHARCRTTVSVVTDTQGELRVSWAGPEGLNLLFRNLEVEGQTYPWMQGYRRSEVQPLVLRSPVRPFIGLPANTSAGWFSLLRQLGYIAETSNDPGAYSVYLDHLGSNPEVNRSVIAGIEEGNQPLVKLGRWPGNTRSALAITGDIDALTIGDYGLRFLGR